MKIQAFIFILLVYSSTFSQSKEETIQWIIEKNDLYKNPNEVSLKIKEKYFYKDGKSILRVKIKDIDKIRIKEDSYNSIKYSTIEMQFNVGKLEYKDEKDSEFRISYNKSDNKISLILSYNFIIDGLKSRMENALVHLIKLYGGKATIFKEPF